jgi:hypothetical protein
VSFIFALLLASNVVWCQLETEKTVSVIVHETNPDEVKSVILHTAVWEWIKDHAGELNLDFSAFGKKLNDKFEVYFKELKDREFQRKYGKSYGPELTPELKSAFSQAQDYRRPLELAKFSQFSQILDQYSFKTIEQDKLKPEQWRGTVILNLNRGKLDRLAARILSDENKQFKTIFIVTEMNLMGLTWSDLGLENEKSFKEALESSWEKWFGANLPDNIGNVIPCRSECLEGFSHWLELPQDENIQVSGEFSGSLWLKISLNLRRTSLVKDTSESTFEWNGSLVLLNANNKMVLANFTLPYEKKTWRGLDQKGLNSAIATSLYRFPLDDFLRMNRKIQEASALNRLKRLVITGHKTLEDLLSLIEILRRKGTDLKLELRLENFSRGQAEILCFYQGEEKKFIDLLSRVKELKSLHNYSVVSEFSGVHPTLKLVTE